MESGPNHYNLLKVSRDASSTLLKKAYRTLSLELHPDKNKSPTAAEDFQKAKVAFDVLIDRELRGIYERLGDAGVKAAKHTVIDHKYILLQMLVYYGSTAIFAFMMNFSEATGDSMSLSFFGLFGTSPSCH
jgi:DnaJ-class molecular chaperone